MPNNAIKKSRIVKDPETFRQKAIKASNEDNKSSKTGRFLLNAILVPIKPVKSFLIVLGKTRVVKYIWKFLRVPMHYIGLIILPKYIRNSWKELKLVTWPNWKTSRKLTTAVIVFAVVFGVTVALVDFLLNKLFRDVLLK
jgi:preprotein translocase SecE subunit